MQFPAVSKPERLNPTRHQKTRFFGIVDRLWDYPARGLSLRNPDLRDDLPNLGAGLLGSCRISAYLLQRCLGMC